tara:strand:+ start:6522 stop:6689 length:168 start_codon:yes stop_codon:yes gene_type:complete
MLSLAMDKEGRPCRYVAKAETDEGVIADMVNHISTQHDIDGDDHVENIRACIRTH